MSLKSVPYISTLSPSHLKSVPYISILSPSSSLSPVPPLPYLYTFPHPLFLRKLPSEKDHQHNSINNNNMGVIKVWMTGVLVAVLGAIVNGYEYLSLPEDDNSVAVERSGTDAAILIDIAPVQLFANHYIDIYIELYDGREDSPYVIDWGDGDILHDTLLLSDGSAYQSHLYHDPGDYKITIAVQTQNHIFYERNLVWVWDKHLKAHPHIQDECVHERARSQHYDLVLRWFYIGVLFLIIIILVALMIIAWLLCCSVCAIKKI
ncbi:hypothetical protein Pcinc_019399 [Petrolisthes cinctipes]|uniref:Uncharacterized protein n=1 Tax=Petrolisthes cinctipes TaxID=88211 RepID=A0AAE1FK97_PETCI|nr:hypothetical protein Pcinc_019399 [Petrolisthes cinctipes]